uniref:Protein C35C5.8, isoform a n=1 Tax=Haemonchus contortus TaxID=6289 RepID=W6NDM0_HAECO
MTSVGSRAMRVTPDIVVLIICGLLKPTVSTWIFEGVSSRELDEVRDIGRKAKVEFVNKVVGETDHLKRNSYYLDGLEKCNNIERNWTDSVQDDAFRHGNVTDAVWLQKAGMKEFTALFMTLPPHHMERIARAACAKHEKQLTCGAEYEGTEVTMKRVAELKKIGNHKMMFEKECKDKDFIKRVYPCVGHDVSKWIEPCSEQVNTYSTLRDSVNQRISDTYDSAVKKVKATTGDDRKEDLKIFDKAMSSIAFLEGSKCGLFREMRVCVLRQLLEHCGVEAMKAFNTSISLGYLRTERRERLNLDFEVFNYPVHPNCIGL